MESWKEIAKSNGLTSKRFCQRVRDGWTYREAATTPLRKRIDHRLNKHYLFRTFRNLQNRDKRRGYEHLGKDVICKEWSIKGITCSIIYRKKFTNFLNHYTFLAKKRGMTAFEAYTKRFSLDRRDWRKGYSPENVFRLATRIEQANNKKNNIVSLGKRVEIAKFIGNSWKYDYFLKEQ